MSSSSHEPIDVFGPGEGLPTTAELQSYLAFTVGMSRKAGELIKKHMLNRHKTIETKSSEIDLVTATDKETEDTIIAAIRAVYPDHVVISEETFSTVALTDTPTWIVDPIDGTSNFVHSLPLVCVSVALAIRQRIVMGVVYNPISEECFTAIRGGGSFLNGSRLSVSEVTTITKASISIEFGYDRTPEGNKQNLDRLSRLLEKRVQCFRSFGTCALNLCFLAAGRTDGYFEGRSKAYGPKCWDMAAAGLVLLEAGGQLCDISGRKFDLFCGRLLGAATPELHEELKSLLHDLVDSD